VRTGRGADDRGSGTVLALALIAVVLVAAAAIGLLAGAQAARSQAQSGADLAALAGATQLARIMAVAGLDSAVTGRDAAVTGLDPARGGAAPLIGRSAATALSGSAVDAACAVAAESARRNRVTLTGCSAEPGAVLRVETSRRSPAGAATANARAGPRSSR